jgi:hypothetical protein
MYVLAFKQKFDHFPFEYFSVVRVHHAEFFFVDKHGLLGHPQRPGFFGYIVKDALSQLAGIKLKILPFGLAL